MSTYIEILRAHQRGRLKANEPSQQTPTTILPEAAIDTSPDELLQEEASEQAPEQTIRDEAVPEAATTPSAPLDEEGDASPGNMPQEGMGATSPTPDADDAVAEGSLPDEPGNSVVDSSVADDEAPEGILQEESAASPIPDADTMAEGRLPDEPGNGVADSEPTDDEPSAGMLQEELGSPSPADTMAEEDLPDEPGNPLPELSEAEDFSLDHLLQEETRHPPPDFDNMDDAIFAQMLQDEPEPPSAEPRHPEQDESAATLTDETSPKPHAHPTEGVAAEDGVHTWLSGCVMLMVRIYEDAARNTATDISPMLKHLEHFSAKIYDEPEELNALELDIANRIESIRHAHGSCGDLVQKAVMMMLYAYKVCVQMRMEPAEMNRYVAAAILHNIGMAQIFVDTRQKEGALTNAERTLIRRVPDASREYLKLCGITDRVILLAAEQSHERYDGSGPRGLAGADIALSARIIGLLSIFEALVHVRSYRERLLPLDAIRELVNGQKNRFDPAMLKALIESVSLYPVGTYVQLNSGDIGQVIRVQPRLPLRPQIVLTMDRHGNHIQPREVDLHKQPNLMIQRCMYREGLAPIKREDKAQERA